jgi:hypothetical protein
LKLEEKLNKREFSLSAGLMKLKTQPSVELPERERVRSKKQ